MAALLINCDLNYVDGTSKHVMVRPAAMIKFERHYNCGMADISKRTEYVMFLVYSQLVIDNETVPVFDSWVRQVADIQVSTGNPTQAPAEEAL